jgi:hypothetical protein
VPNEGQLNFKLNNKQESTDKIVASRQKEFPRHDSLHHICSTLIPSYSIPLYPQLFRIIIVSPMPHTRLFFLLHYSVFHQNTLTQYNLSLLNALCFCFSLSLFPPISTNFLWHQSSVTNPFAGHNHKFDPNVCSGTITIAHFTTYTYYVLSALRIHKSYTKMHVYVSISQKIASLILLTHLIRPFIK